MSLLYQLLQFCESWPGLVLCEVSFHLKLPIAIVPRPVLDENHTVVLCNLREVERINF